MTSTTELFEVDRIKWGGSRELVWLASLDCQWCRGGFDVTYEQPALFVHGGYGATDRIRVRGCLCGALFLSSYATVRPRR